MENKRVCGVGCETFYSAVHTITMLTATFVAIVLLCIPVAATFSSYAKPTLKPLARINFGPPRSAPGYDDYLVYVAGAPTSGLPHLTGRTGFVAGTPDVAAYNTNVYRKNFLSYSLPGVVGKKYNIKLGFAEVYLPSCRNGRRVFSASVNGRFVHNVDVFAAVGCNHAYDLMFNNITAVNGVIEIKLQAGVVSYPMISNLEIFVASDSSVPDPGQVVASVNFGAPWTGSYQTADPALLSGSYNAFSGGGVSTRDVDGDITSRSYDSHLWTTSSLSYRIKVPNGVLYDVKLGFAETHIPSWHCGPSGLGLVGKRVFSASVSGRTVRNIDVAKSVRCLTAYDLFFRGVRPTNGEILVSVFKGPSQNAMISNAVVYKAHPDVVTPPRPQWALVNTTGQPTARHEACFVMVGGKGYLIGGRGASKPVDVYDPVTRTWSKRAGPGVELHHMQCVGTNADDLGSRSTRQIYIVSAWLGRFPNEQNHKNMYIYDTIQDRWSVKHGLPEHRRRGGASAVLFKGKIYVTHGNRGGHGQQATTLGWMDAYDIASDTWETNLPDAPHPRDHTGGVMVNGKLCVAGGRDGGAAAFFNAPILSTDCYNFETGKWEIHANIPTGRAGAAYGQTCDGRMMVAGGEGSGNAFNNVDIFDGSSWKSGPPLRTARHGSGLAMGFCGCGQITIAAGASTQGGAKEINSTETYFLDGDANKRCA